MASADHGVELCTKHRTRYTRSTISRKKIRAKVSGKGAKRSGGAGDASSSSSTANKRSKASATKGSDETTAAAERAPEPPDSSLSDAKLAEIEVKINRSPVMVLWATVRSLSLSVVQCCLWPFTRISALSWLRLWSNQGGKNIFVYTYTVDRRLSPCG